MRLLWLTAVVLHSGRAVASCAGVAYELDALTYRHALAWTAVGERLGMAITLVCVATGKGGQGQEVSRAGHESNRENNESNRDRDETREHDDLILDGRAAVLQPMSIYTGAGGKCKACLLF